MRAALAGAIGALLALTFAVTTLGPASDAATANPITPGAFTGKGFDQCEAPSQKAMSAWRASSPYRAVGIYISGSLRFCQEQRNLTSTWVSTQLRAGWHLLPIHLGAQASCTTRDRYQKNKISADPTSTYADARSQGRAEARSAVAAAKRLGIVPKSTIYYDLEAFNASIASCKWSSLWFLSAWTNTLHSLGYVSGVYSSAASGIKVLDDARVTPGNRIALPDQIWIADWNGKADTNSTYIRSDGWPGARLHQYRGGHNETWGGVKINIDNNYVDLRGPSSPPRSPSTAQDTSKCTGRSISRTAYRRTSATQNHALALPLQCLLTQRHLYTANVTGRWNAATLRALQAFQRGRHHKATTAASRGDWVALTTLGSSTRTLRRGSRGPDVIRIQRAMNAATSAHLKVTGVFNRATGRAVASYRSHLKMHRSQAVTTAVWTAVHRGRW